MRRVSSVSVRCLSTKASSEHVVGPLVSRGVPDFFDQDSEIHKIENISSTREGSGSYKRFIPSEALEWKRLNDREAGEDEGLAVEPHRRVPDTNLVKAKTGSGYRAVKTAGIDTIIDILAQPIVLESEVVAEIISRVTYIGSTLSVKQIRLFLSAFAKTQCLPPRREAMEEMMHVLGEELLCRFHGLTLLSCRSIVESMAAIPYARHEGLLNVIAIAYKQNIEEPVTGQTHSDDHIVKCGVEILSSYNKMDYLLPTILETALKSLDSRTVAFKDKLKVLEILLPKHADIVMSSLVPTCREIVDHWQVDDVMTIVGFAHDCLRDVAKEALLHGVRLSEDNTFLHVPERPGSTRVRSVRCDIRTAEFIKSLQPLE